MGSLKNYKIDWYNAMTGQFVGVNFQSSGLFGNLNLEIPFTETLTGNASQPILFFQLYPSGETFKSSQQDTTQTDKIILNNMLIDSTVSELTPTNWQIQNNEVNTESSIKVLPNPTDGEVLITFNLTETTSHSWQLINSDGEILQSGIINTTNLKLNLSVYPAGLYHFTLINSSQKLTVKIIKQ